MESSFPRRAVPNRRQCAYCDCELPVHTHADVQHCQAFACKHAWDKESFRRRREQEKEAQAQLTYRIEQFRAQQSRALKTATDKITVVRVPHNDHQAVKQSKERRDNFLAHLTELAGTLDQSEPEETFRAKVETPAAPHLDEVLTAGCTTCRGYCCLQGEDYHAFIQRSTLNRVLAENTDLTADDLVAHYEQHIPEQAMDAGCVYQTATGCCLPSDLRANICHEYFCEGLHLFVKENDRQTPDYSVIIATDNAEPMDANRVSRRGEWTHLDVGDI